MEDAIRIFDYSKAGEGRELPDIMDEISFSYMLVYSAQESLSDLDKAIKELSDLVDFYKADNKL